MTKNVNEIIANLVANYKHPELSIVKENNSQSDILRTTIVNNPISSKEATKTEDCVRIAAASAFDYIKNKYKDLNIIDETSLYKVDIFRKLRSTFSDPQIGSNISVSSSSIKPDGKIIYLVIDKIKYLLCVVEAKKQGTNDKRASEGKEKQAKGNAIERAVKNFNEIRLFLFGENIFPYIIFARGCDVEDKTSSIRDRLTSMTLGSPFNQLYTYNIIDNNGNNHPRASIFIGEISIENMTKTITEMLETSIQYYINKYISGTQSAI